MKYAKLVIGLFFLTNPYFGAFDYLPDFVGLLLMASAIKPLCEVSPSAEAANSALKRAAAVSVAQIALMIPLLSIISSEPSFNLLYSFSFAVLRLIYLIPAVSGLFDSIGYFSDRSLATIRGKGAARIGTLSFLIFHCILSALPDVVYIAVDEYGLYGDAIFPHSIYRTGLMFLCAFVVLIAGMLWFIPMTVFTVRLRKCPEFNSCIEKAVAEVVHSVKKTVLKSVSPIIFCLTAAFLTLALYFIDGKPLIPTYFSGIFMLTAVIYLRRICSKKPSRVFPILSIVFGALTQIFCDMFGVIAHDRALFAFEEVKAQFMLPFSACALYTLVAVMSVISICRGLCGLIDEHTGLFWENAFITHNASIGREKMHQIFAVRTLCVISCLSLLFSLSSYWLLYRIPELNLIASLVSVAIGTAYFFILGRIKSSVIEKYTTENKMN
jgi:hypothetical protein